MTLDLFTIETVDLPTWQGPRRMPVHRYQEFAVHRWDVTDMFDRWRVTHLPSGHMVSRNFPNIDQAAEAAVAIARLRNDWAVIQEADLTPELRDKVREITARFGGEIVEHERPSIRSERNGYGAAAE
jgi:hypothetical protein